jgi:hypothetical protein
MNCAMPALARRAAAAASDLPAQRILPAQSKLRGRNLKLAPRQEVHFCPTSDDVAAALGTIFAAYCSLALITDALGDEVDPRRMARAQREIGWRAAF